MTLQGTMYETHTQSEEFESTYKMKTWYGLSGPCGIFMPVN